MESFNYHDPVVIKNVLTLLRHCGEDTYLLAGGTDMMPKLRNRVIRPKHIISLKKVSELDVITADASTIRIGAMTTHARIAENALLERIAPVLTQACRSVGSPQIRNLGTIGGNIVNASAAADTVVALMALDASCVFKSTEGERTVALRELFAGNGEARLERHELLTEIFFARPNENTVSGFAKLGRRGALSIVIVSIGVLLERSLERNPTHPACTNARVVLGGVSRHPCRVRGAEHILSSQVINASTLEHCLGELSTFTVNSLENSPFKHLAPHKRHAVRGIGRTVLRTLFDTMASGL